MIYFLQVILISLLVILGAIILILGLVELVRKIKEDPTIVAFIFIFLLGVVIGYLVITYFSR